MIRFQKPYKTRSSSPFIQEVMDSDYLQGDGKYTNLCTNMIQDMLSVKQVFMMTSCTHALECALQVIGLESEDEVIVPSFTYPSTANAILLAGGTVVYGEVEGENLTLDYTSIQKKLTKKTKAIIVVHYGGVSCDMDKIMVIAKKHQLVVIEDAAQSFLATYKEAYTGTIGDFGCFSFHGTKDFVAGEGGALVVNNPKYLAEVEHFRQKGTNRTAFLNGESAFYQWVSKGSSYSPNELSMALLYGQFLLKEEILQKRRSIYHFYQEALAAFILQYNQGDKLTMSRMDASAVNGHLFFILFKEVEYARAFSDFLYKAGIETRTHFVPLHESSMGQQFIREEDRFAVEKDLGQKLVRLPIYPDLSEMDRAFIIRTIDSFFCQQEVL